MGLVSPTTLGSIQMLSPEKSTCYAFECVGTSLPCHPGINTNVVPGKRARVVRLSEKVDLLNDAFSAAGVYKQSNRHDLEHIQVWDLCPLILK